ncbi:MAG: AhpC/TSA family protein [Bacteroides sp.]|nr:AhpC/TSA family protein [Bacteroides sp.]
MKKLFLLALLAVAITACNTKPQFVVEGTVSDAADKVLYFEASALSGIVPLDSVTLGSSGSFRFKGMAPESPEFYRLRVDNKVINFSVDSTETVSIEAAYSEFATGYRVEGSASSQRIKELSLMQMHLQSQTDALAKLAQSRQIGMDVFQDSLNALVNNFKSEVKSRYIYAAPYDASAYFALFQRLNNVQIFDPLSNKDDVRCFAAVATSLDNKYPHADRTKNLYNIAIKGLKNTRQVQQPAVDLPIADVQETGIIDITLNDVRGKSHKLSDLKGKVVLLDFTIYQTEVSAAHNVALNQLYQQYASEGLEIYQVSFDVDEHYWKTVASNLPWICVRDINSTNSSLLSSYNVQGIPAIYLINRNNELSARGETIEDFEEAIKKLL